MGETTINLLNWRSVVLIMALLPLLICAAILWFRPVEKHSSRYLSVLFVLISLSVGPHVIGFANFYDHWPGLTYFPLFYTTLWLGPLLYFHAYALMIDKIPKWSWALFIPGSAQLVYYLWAFFGIGQGWRDYEAKWAFNGSFHSPYFWPIETVLALGFFAFALITTARLTKRYKVFLEGAYSQAVDFDPIWLRYMLMGLTLAGGLYFVSEIIGMWRPGNYELIYYVLVLIIFVVVWLAINAAFRLARPFPKMPTEGLNVVNQENSVDANIAAQIDLVEKIKANVESQNWYLEAQLSIRDIAARLGTNESYISRALNQSMGSSFNRYINTLRVDHAKTLIRDNRFSMIDVGFDSGFNSKATFNRVFRDISGQTPSAFKKSQIP